MNELLSMLQLNMNCSCIYNLKVIVKSIVRHSSYHYSMAYHKHCIIINISGLMMITRLKILFTQYTCASVWWQLVLNTANLWMQLTLKAAVATHVLDVFHRLVYPQHKISKGVPDYLSEVSQSSKAEWWIYFVLWLGLWEFWPWPWKSNQIRYKGALLPPWINFNPNMDK